MPPGQIHIAIADDHTFFRKLLSDYLSSQPNIKVSISVSDASDLLHKLKNNRVDIILLDLFMPKLKSFDAIRIIANVYPAVKIIVLSMCTDLKVVSKLLDFGIHAYISKCDEPSSLLDAITSISNNKFYRNYLFIEALFHNREGKQTKQIGNTNLLNEREKMIIQALWEENSNLEIANDFCLSIRSVEKIRQDIKNKIGFKSLAGMFKYALGHGIISIGIGDLDFANPVNDLHHR